MKIKIIYIPVLIAASFFVLGSCRKEKIQPEQAESFIKYYGKGGTQTAGNVALTPDGGYVMVGTSDSYGNGKDILVVKTDQYGNQQWEKVIGGAGNDEGNWVQVSTDGGYIIAGSRAETSSLTNTDANIIKLNSDGSVVWDKTYGLIKKDEKASRVINTLDGGYISIGTSDTLKNAKSGVYLIKVTGSGDSLWTAKYGNNSLFNTGTAIQQVSELSYITSAYTSDETGTPASLDMLVTTGRLQLNPFFYNSNSSIGKQLIDPAVINAKDVILGNAADKYILGNTSTGDIYITNVSSGEEKISYTTFGTSAQDMVSGFSRTSDGGFIVAGSTLEKGSWDVLVIRTNSRGEVIWMKTFGENGNDYGVSAAQSPDGGFVVSATMQFGGNSTGSNALMSIIKLNSDGELK